MTYVRNTRQVRRKSVKEKQLARVSKSNNSRQMARQTTFEPFWVCGTNTGWFLDCCCCYKKTQIAGELGVGVSVYFKQLKNLIIILLLCTLLSMPAYNLFWSGRVINNPDRTTNQGFNLNTGLAAISLANIGEKSTMELELNLNRKEQ